VNPFFRADETVCLPQTNGLLKFRPTSQNRQQSEYEQTKDCAIIAIFEGNQLPPTTNTFTVPEELSGKRLDQAISSLFSDYSRSRLKSWIESGLVLVNDQKIKPRTAVFTGDIITVTVTTEPETECKPEDIPIEVVYEDDSLIVINKQAGLVVHPGAGNYKGTLLNGLLHFDSDLCQVPRAGIVHRLDKNTTGLMVVARNLKVHTYLVNQMKDRLIEREYDAITSSVMTGGGTVDAPIGRHKTDRTRMAVTDNGREAVTHYRVVKKYRFHTHIKARLETGRTHQIRVHMAHIHYPLAGDRTYNGRRNLPGSIHEEAKTAIYQLNRQALVASRLALTHPNGEAMEWTIGLPDDFTRVLDALALDSEQHQQ